MSTPTIQLSQQSISFGASFGIANDPAPQFVNLTVPSGGVLPFTAASDSTWLTVNPQSGSAPQLLTVTAILGTAYGGNLHGPHHRDRAGRAGLARHDHGDVRRCRRAGEHAFLVAVGSEPAAHGMVGQAGQNAASQLADIVYDPFVKQEQAEIPGGDLTVHYQAPLTDGNDVYMMTKTGTYKSCSSAGAWAKRIIVRAEHLVHRAVERGAIHVAERETRAGVDFCERLEAGAQWFRAARVGACVSSRGRKRLHLRARRGRHGLESEPGRWNAGRAD